jgi:hypothetical protein
MGKPPQHQPLLAAHSVHATLSGGQSTGSPDGRLATHSSSTNSSICAQLSPAELNHFDPPAFEGALWHCRDQAPAHQLCQSHDSSPNPRWHRAAVHIEPHPLTLFAHACVLLVCCCRRMWASWPLWCAAMRPCWSGTCCQIGAGSGLDWQCQPQVCGHVQLRTLTP